MGSGAARILVSLVIVGTAATVARAEDKYLKLAYDSAYASMASAEGYSAGSHLRAVMDKLRVYLSNGYPAPTCWAWVTYNRGFLYACWGSPASGGAGRDFLLDLMNDFPTGNSTSHAICVGFTGKTISSGGLLGAAPSMGSVAFPRHAAIFYRNCKYWAGRWGKNRFTLTRAVASQEVGHLYGDSGHHNTGNSRVSQNGPCSMNGDDGTGRGVYTYCPNHLTFFYNYQKSKGTNW